MADLMVELRGVCKAYGARAALHPTDLTLTVGATHALVGQSGCGKSTLVRVVAGLVRPDAGTVRVKGELLRPESIRALRHSVGYVIQEGGLFPHLTAAQNAGLLAGDLGWTPARVAERVGELAALVHLDPDTLTRYPQQLSGGQRQRVALMRALMLDPPILLMDEPLGALDPLIRARLQADLREIFARLRKAVLLVTHDMAEAAYLAASISVMREGRTLQTGPVRELLQRPADPYVAELITAQRPLASEAGP